MSYPTPIGDQLVEEYRCQDRGGPDGQRCQLLIEHDPPHIASISGTVRGWTIAVRRNSAWAVPLGAELPMRG